MSVKSIRLVMFCGLLIAGRGLQAHHSLAGVYDLDKEITFTATLTKMEFVNPHSMIHVTATNPDGSTTDWVLMTVANTALVKQGITRSGPNGLKAGDVLSITAFPARNGNPFGFLKSIVAPGNREVRLFQGDGRD